MKLTFLGTRGYIEAESDRHRMHSSLLVAYRGRRVMIDCGETWRGGLDAVAPHAIVVTHGHPDHVFGLGDGAPCPVWAPEAVWTLAGGFPVQDRRTVEPRRPFEPAPGISFEAFPVAHSIRAPAVGYRVTAGRVAIFYAPDVVYVPERRDAFAGCRVYVGDGATVDRNLVRRPGGDALVGHAPVRTQLTWCRDERVPRMIVTHCGTQIVQAELKDPEALQEKLRRYASERGVEVEVAYDGMERVLR
jgi:phosphoribosyl 1,2-cyclic phosphodiesterase